jgi:hypothetical protein
VDPGGSPCVPQVGHHVSPPGSSGECVVTSGRIHWLIMVSTIVLGLENICARNRGDFKDGNLF